jgi:hypothetical protein
MSEFDSSHKQVHSDRVSNDNTIVNKTATATLTPSETYVVITPAAAATITLPPVGACRHGHEVALYIVNVTAGNVTIEDNAGDNLGGFTDIVIDQAAVLVIFKNVASRHWVLSAAKLAGAALPTLANIAV